MDSDEYFEQLGQSVEISMEEISSVRHSHYVINGIRVAIITVFTILVGFTLGKNTISHPMANYPTLVVPFSPSMVVTSKKEGGSCFQILTMGLLCVLFIFSFFVGGYHSINSYEFDNDTYVDPYGSTPGSPTYGVWFLEKS